MTQNRQDITALLQAASQNDDEAFNVLYGRVYDELRRLARTVRKGREVYTLNTTALVHEAYFKLMLNQKPNWQNRLHFFRIAARAMRQVLINAAKRRAAAKRGGGHLTVQFNEQVHAPTVTPESLLALEDALQQLEGLDPKQARIVECRFFAGLTIEETAQVLGTSPATVKREWRTARAWLGQVMKANA